MKVFTRFTALLLSGMALSSSAQKTPSNLISQENRAATPTLIPTPTLALRRRGLGVR